MATTPSPVSGPATSVSPQIESTINRTRGGGYSLPKKTRSQMEQRLGTDFSGVRVHTDSRADGLNQTLQAKAFTTGQAIFFRQGEYNPNSQNGQELIAHELTHVVQQNGNAVQPKRDRQQLQRIIGNQAVGRLLTRTTPHHDSQTSMAPNKSHPTLIQRKINYTDKVGVKQEDGMEEWLKAFFASKYHRMESLPGFHKFRLDSFRTIHIDINNTDPAYASWALARESPVSSEWG